MYGKGFHQCVTLNCLSLGSAADISGMFQRVASNSRFENESTNWKPWKWSWEEVFLQCCLLKNHKKMERSIEGSVQTGKTLFLCTWVGKSWSENLIKRQNLVHWVLETLNKLSSYNAKLDVELQFECHRTLCSVKFIINKNSCPKRNEKLTLNVLAKEKKSGLTVKATFRAKRFAHNHVLIPACFSKHQTQINEIKFLANHNYREVF